MKGGLCLNLNLNLMCKSTAVCLSHEYHHRSVVAPDRINNNKYVRLPHVHVDNNIVDNVDVIPTINPPAPPSTSLPFHVSSSSSSSLNNQNNQQSQSAAAAADVPISPHLFQVVVMRVSIHCQGCASKLKKHLSKMQGVTSFSIDLESKRVTVTGHVSPSGVLESISKVKKAEFW